MNIVVLAGGLSPERDVSLSSGCKIANALIENGHNVLLADVFMGLPAADNFADAYDKYRKERYEFQVPEHEPDMEAVKASSIEYYANARTAAGPDAYKNTGDTHTVYGGCGADSLIGDGILSVCADADITFNALHGSIGEDGQIQAVFDIFGIKYTGTGYSGSFIAMDKPIAKELMHLYGVDTPEWRVFDVDEDSNEDILNRIELPCVIKPCGCGSSVGISFIRSPDELNAALEYARLYDKRIIVEKIIVGREFSVGVLGGEALPPIEIIPYEGFYDYKNKYQPGATLEVCPPDNLSPVEDDRLRAVALKLHKILRLGDYSRMDVIMDGAGTLFCLEMNTLPGMTPTSLLPQEAAAAGLSYRQLCEKIVNLAIARG